MNDVPQGFLTSSDCSLCVMHEMCPNPLVGADFWKLVQNSLQVFFMETQTPSKATSLQSLWSLQVVCMNFFDIVLDFILMDAFEDLESPPSSVVAVLRNRWLSDSFKETVNKLHVDASHSSSICFTYLTMEWCAFIFARLWQQLAGLSWKRKDVFSWWVDLAGQHAENAAWRPRILTPRSASPHRFLMASSPISMPYQNTWARF